MRRLLASLEFYLLVALIGLGMVSALVSLFR